MYGLLVLVDSQPGARLQVYSITTSHHAFSVVSVIAPHHHTLVLSRCSHIICLLVTTSVALSRVTLLGVWIFHLALCYAGSYFLPSVSRSMPMFLDAIPMRLRPYSSMVYVIDTDDSSIRLEFLPQHGLHSSFNTNPDN